MSIDAKSLPVTDQVSVLSSPAGTDAGMASKRAMRGVVVSIVISTLAVALSPAAFFVVSVKVEAPSIGPEVTLAVRWVSATRRAPTGPSMLTVAAPATSQLSSTRSPSATRLRSALNLTTDGAVLGSEPQERQMRRKDAQETPRCMPRLWGGNRGQRKLRVADDHR